MATHSGGGGSSGGGAGGPRRSHGGGSGSVSGKRWMKYLKIALGVTAVVGLVYTLLFVWKLVLMGLAVAGAVFLFRLYRHRIFERFPTLARYVCTPRSEVVVVLSVF